MEQEKLKEEIKAELKKEMKSEIKKQSNKKGNNSFVALLVAIIVLLAGYIIYTDFIAKPEPKSDQTEETKKEEIQETIEITDNIKSQLKDILGLKDGSVDLLYYEGIESFKYDYTILKCSGIINELTNYQKLTIISDYARRHNMAKDIKGEEYDWCFQGSGCTGYTEEDFKKIITKFGITDNYNDFFTKAGYKKYKNMYITVNGSGLVTAEVKHNLTFSNYKSDIIATNNYTITEHDKNIESYTKKYTFKKNESGYYLYSMK